MSNTHFAVIFWRGRNVILHLCLLMLHLLEVRIMIHVADVDNVAVDIHARF